MSNEVQNNICRSQTIERLSDRLLELFLCPKNDNPHMEGGYSGKIKQFSEIFFRKNKHLNKIYCTFALELIKKQI